MLGAAVVLASLAAGMALPASAQSPSIQKYGEPDKVKTPADIAAEKEAEKAYQRSLGDIPAKQNVDPWGTVRSESAAPKAAAKTTDKAVTAKPKAKSADSKTDGAAKQ
jgi:hypothetical protein